MTIYRQFVFFGLLLISVNSLAQDESSLQSAGNIRLSGTEDPATSKVFIVQLRSPSAAEHHASSQIKLRFNKNDAAVQAYAAKITLEQDRVFEKIGPNARKIYSYKYGLNGFAARMSIAQARKLESFPEVLNVWEDEIRPLATRNSATFLGLFDQDSGLRSAHGLSGDGLVIAVIDSGIAPEHPALLDIRAADKPRLCRSSWAETSLLGRWLCRRFDHAPGTVAFEALEDWVGECEAGEEFTASDCNNKLIGARWFIDGADNSGPIDDGEFRSPRDADGHGTHTATTAAGNRVSASIFGTTIGDIEGMAPGARIAVYKACWLRPDTSRASCNTSDLATAIDMAIADGVDIISYSVGSSMHKITAPDDIALMAAAKAGIVAVVAAGNEGPNPATIGSPAGGPWVITVAASTRDGESSVEAMQVSTPPSIAGKYASKEALFSPPLQERDPIEGQLVLVDDADDTLPNGAAGVSSDGCQPLENDAEVSGNIALLQRSGCLFTDMVRNAEDAGAVAALIYNIAGDPFVMHGESGLVDIPTLMIGQADANLMLAELDAGNEINVVLEKSFLLTTPDSGNVMATFSARGPGPVADILKPDVSAPGVNILAGFSPRPANATPGENFAFLSGTSMSTPHVAGVAALLLEAHPTWTPAAVKSALMTTARQDLQSSASIAPANPFDFGAGHIVPNDAFDPGLVYDLSNDEYDAFACGTASPAVTSARCDALAATGLSFLARDMNQPSISISRLANQQVISRHVTNVGDEAGSYNVNVAAPPGIRIDVNPPSISLATGATATFTVTLTYESGPMDLWRFGSLTWSNDTHNVYSTIAVKPTSISAAAEITSFGGTGEQTFPVEFGYTGSYAARVHGLNLPYIEQRTVANDPTKTFTRRADNGVTEHALLVPSDQLFLRFSLFDALTDGDDDLDMYVYYCGLDGSSCTRIGESGEPTSQEQFNLYRPAPGVYGVYIHGYETDEVSGGPGATYELLAWSIGSIDDKGNMTVTGPAFVNAGTTADITVNWTGLLSNTIYLGGISHNTPQGLSALTIVTIGN